ncbi:MAG: hypothetical protein OHK0046_27830 [Anaerolineae bacterium]
MERAHMAERTITLRAELVEQLETLAATQGRTLDDLLSDLVAAPQPISQPNNRWTVQVAEAMAAADIEWLDVPTLSEDSRKLYEEAQYQAWLRTQHHDEQDNG